MQIKQLHLWILLASAFGAGVNSMLLLAVLLLHQPFSVFIVTLLLVYFCINIYVFLPHSPL